MIQKKRMILLGVWFVSLVSLGFLINWNFNFNNCKFQEMSISQDTKIQDQWLYNYASFSTLNLDYDRLKPLEKMIGLREPGIKKQIEMFAENCKSKVNKMYLDFMLSDFESYLRTKEKLMGGYQDFNWIRNLQADKK